jgi:peptidoglycan-associated lipoprotein
MKFQHLCLIACLIALSACASKVRLDDLPPVIDRGVSSTTAQGSGSAPNNNGLGVNGSAANGSAANSLGTNVAGSGSNNSASSAATSTGSTVTTVQAGSNTSAQPNAGMLAKRSVYFDYDSFAIRDDAKPILQAHAKNLSNNRALKIALEGHTDERGGSEYNLALGQKRANAVQEALQLLGVPAAQMEAVSFGKEKPKALGNDEAGYAENRRSDIQYK